MLRKLSAGVRIDNAQLEEKVGRVTQQLALEKEDILAAMDRKFSSMDRKGRERHERGWEGKEVEGSASTESRCAKHGTF